MRDKSLAVGVEETLRKDCKSLLSSLKKHQNILNKSLNNKNTSLVRDKQNTEFMKTSIYDSPPNPTCLTKTVSFSGDFSCRRRIRSNSPKYSSQKPKPSKSILKNTYKKDESKRKDKEERSEHLSSSSSSSCSSSRSESLTRAYSTNFLNGSSSNLYACDDTEDYLKDLIQFNSKHPNDNTRSLIEFIARKRRAYLNHSYNDFVSLNEMEVDDNLGNQKKSSKNKKRKELSYAKPTLSFLNMSKNNNKMTNENKTNDKSSSINNLNAKIKKRNYKKIAKNAKKSKPLLGYDWALDLAQNKLNTTQAKFEKPDEYWLELSQFRDMNKQECVSANEQHFDGTLCSLFDNTLLIENANGNNRDNFDGLDDGINHKCKINFIL
jgi:hypothetical protein